MIARVVIVGAGAFGTALALVAQRAGRRVTLIARDAGQAEDITNRRQNVRHLAGVEIPPEVEITAGNAACGDADLVLLAAPAQATRAVLSAIAPHVPPQVPILACAKGIERGSGARQTEIIGELVPQSPAAALSGPGFAEEIARGLPTAVTIAAADVRVAHALAAALAGGRFRPYASDDPIGVEFGGAVKNVLAIAAGIVAGRALGESARAALLARGLAEMTRLGEALGARAETFMGLSGLGDLVLTATSRRSRNLAFGMALGEGRRPADLLTHGMPLVEGAPTAGIAASLARRHGIDAPIVAAVAAILAGRLDIDAAIEGLVARPLKAE